MIRVLGNNNGGYMNNDSILNSIKKLLGIEEDYKHFDVDLIIHINSVFSVLNQLGVGPDKVYEISDESNTWDEFIKDNNTTKIVKSYMYLKIRLLFDPPTNSFLLESINKQISEMEWRMNVSDDNS